MISELIVSTQVIWNKTDIYVWEKFIFEYQVTSSALESLRLDHEHLVQEIDYFSYCWSQTPCLNNRLAIIGDSSENIPWSQNPIIK